MGDRNNAAIITPSHQPTPRLREPVTTFCWRISSLPLALVAAARLELARPKAPDFKSSASAYFTMRPNWRKVRGLNSRATFTAASVFKTAALPLCQPSLVETYPWHTCNLSTACGRTSGSFTQRCLSANLVGSGSLFLSLHNAPSPSGSTYSLRALTGL